MSAPVILRLSDGLYNAGILGFIRVLEHSQRPYETDGFSLRFDGDQVWPHFTQDYLDTLLARFGADTIGGNLLDQMMQVLNPTARETEGFHERLRAVANLIAEKMNRASYQAAVEIIRAAGDEYPFLARAKELKASKVPEEQLALLAEFYPKFREHRETFLLKDIAYTRVQTYWNGISFLHKTKNLTPFVDSFEHEFIQKIVNWKPAKGKNAAKCFQCGAALPSGIQGMAWINDMGVDVKRKTNGFWNFHVDLSPCPVCNLIYACIPLGFSGYAGEGFFINDTVSIRSLIQANQLLCLQPSDKDDTFAAQLSRYVIESSAEKAKRRLENIQVIRRTRAEEHWEYRVNILPGAMLSALARCKKPLETLSKNPYLLRQTMENILNGCSLHPLLIRQAREMLGKGWPLWLLYPILNIQIHLYTTRGTDAMSTLWKQAQIAKQEGAALCKAIADDRNESKIVSLSYRLLNALQTRNPDLYMQALSRQCLSLGRQIPAVFLDALTDEETFMAIGEAFLIGLSTKAGQTNHEEE